ncbi:MAG: transglycosylase SLT domain-containing protein [Nitrospirota bacterium]|nr:transglycosylase SLT domain-containing protein [Nitrospirota bacterium]
MPSLPVVAEAPFLSDPILLEEIHPEGSAAKRSLFSFIIFQPLAMILLWEGVLAFMGYFSEPAMASEWETACSQVTPDLLAARYIQDHSRPSLSSYLAWEIARALVRSSHDTDLPLYLLVAIAQQESSFNVLAINASSGDYGLFQVHYPFWKVFFRKRVGQDLAMLRPEDLLKVSINARVASMILSYDLKLSHGDLVEMLGRYSGRSGEAHKKYVAGILSHSMEFVKYSKGNSRLCLK